MTNKLFAAIPRKVFAVVYIIVFGLFIMLVLFSPNWLIATLCFVLAAGMVILYTIHFEWRMKEAIKFMTRDVSQLATDLSEKEYTGINDETRMFYTALQNTRRELEKKGRNRQELLDVVNAVASHTEIGKLLRHLLPQLNAATRSACSAFYSINHSTNKLEIKHSEGFSKNIYSEFDLNLGEGLVGQAATKNEITYYKDIPEDTVYLIRTFIGKLKPRSMLIVPVISNDIRVGVLVCVSFYDYTQDDLDMIQLIRHYVGVAVSNGANYERNQRLTGELQFQNKLIQDQHEQMKTRLDEKTAWLNSMLMLNKDAVCAIDVRGTVIIWSEAAVQLYGVSGKNAVGKSFDRICEESGWPVIAKAMQEALIIGEYDEKPTQSGGRSVAMNLRCVYDGQHEPLGVIISVIE